MIITTFEADGFRNLADVALRPHPTLNVVLGANGAGKSSLLEAVQCLATGVGFRSRRYRDHLAHGAEEYVLRAELAAADGGAHRCGVRRGRDGSLDARVDYEPVGTFARIARMLPVKVLTPDSHLLVQGTPDERRRFVDWGCFHEDESFLPVWRRYRRALSQRNELLRGGASGAEVGAWNASLSEEGERLHALRARYVSDLATHVKNRTQGVDFPFHVKLDLRSGWAAGDSLECVLVRNLEMHRRMRTTTDGPHRAELVVRVDDHAARDVLSRGQQKLLVYLMHLAQLDALGGGAFSGGSAGEGPSVASGDPPDGHPATGEPGGVGATAGGEIPAETTEGTDVGPVGVGFAVPGPDGPPARRRSSRPPVRPVVLCDDLASELDERAGATLLDALRRSGSQVFVSGTTLPGGLADGGTGPTEPSGGVAAPASDTMLSGPEIPDPPRPFAVFTLDAGRLRD